MLVLSRKVGESVEIARGIVVEIVAMRGDRVRLGFDAPRNVPIVRSELVNRDSDDLPKREGRRPAA